MTLTLEQILSMKSGQELDAQIVEKVMQWKEKVDFDWIGGFVARYVPGTNDVEGFRPSDDIRDAWQVLEWLISKHSDATLTYPWCVVANFDASDWCRWQIKAEGDTAPEAICKSALLSILEQEG